MHFRPSIIVLFVLAAQSAGATPLSEAEKKTILAEHNATREAVAAGVLPDDGSSGTYPTSSNMTELVWNKTAEAVAQAWVDQCNFAHNPNRTEEFLAQGGDPALFYLGQNIAVAYSTEPISTITIESLYAGWAEENVLWSYQPYSSSKVDGAGHFTQIAWAETTEIGCAAAACTEDFDGGKVFNMRLLVCNYGVGGNLVSQEPYRQGAPASACPAGYEAGSGSLCVAAAAVPAP